MTKLSDYVMKFVAAQGARRVFTLPGGGCMHLVDSLGRQKGLEAVGYLHEQARGAGRGDLPGQLHEGAADLNDCHAFRQNRL